MPNTIERRPPSELSQLRQLETSTPVLIKEREKDVNAALYALLQNIAQLLKCHHLDLLNEVGENMQRYSAETDEIKRKKDMEGWGNGTFTVLGALCSICALPVFSDAESLQKFFDAGSRLSEGIKPVLSSWSTASTLPNEQKRAFLQSAFESGRNAANEAVHASDGLVKELLLRLFELDSKTKTVQ